MEVSSFVLLYFGTKIFVRCSEVSVVQRCLLMEVPLYRWGSSRRGGGYKSALPRDFQLKSAVPVIFSQSSTSRHFVIKMMAQISIVRHFHPSRWKEESGN